MLKEKDFIEIEYIGQLKDGTIFDTNIKEEAKKINLEINTKPLVICLGEAMILPAIDKFLIGKKPGEYTIDLEPKDAFGNRKPELVKTVPASVFKNQKVSPFPGAVFYFDNMVGKVTSVSGGRVMVDFNNPLAGKPVQYKIIVKNQIKDIKEKIKALIRFYARKDLSFTFKDNKLSIEADKKEGIILKFFTKKFKEILDFELEIKEKSGSENKIEKSPETK